MIDSDDFDAFEAMLRMEEEADRLRESDPNAWRRNRLNLAKSGFIEIAPDIWARKRDLVAECDSKFSHPRKPPKSKPRVDGLSSNWHQQDRSRAWDFTPSVDHKYVCLVDIPEDAPDESSNLPKWLDNWPRFEHRV